MREEIELVASLQSAWSSTNSGEMQYRGATVRSSLPRQIAPMLQKLMENLPYSLQDLSVEGRDGTGLKSEIPWVRVFSKSRSGSATKGWYLVYLFDAFGDSVYLSINQGTTEWRNGEFLPRPPSQLVERANWARAMLAGDVGKKKNVTESIDLPTRSSALGKGYEFGNVLAIKYEAHLLPLEHELAEDFLFMCGLLTNLYEDLDAALVVPGDAAPEISDAVDLADQAAGRSRMSKRYRLDPLERMAIESRAVERTMDCLGELGYEPKDVGATESYDIHAKKGDETYFVEVKGTVSSGAEVILTRNEVALHLKQYPKNMLSIVSKIELDRAGKTPIASGGYLRLWNPWKLNESQLSPLSYGYAVLEEAGAFASFD